MTDTASAPSLKQLALGDLEHELETTRRVLDRVPEQHLDWKPHAKSFSLGQLATHLTQMPFWVTTTITQDELDVAGAPRTEPLDTHAAIMRRFDDNVADAREALQNADESTFGNKWSLKAGDHVILSMPRLAVLRSFCLSHMIHHRGQLSVYLRLLDVPVPSIYGPTADEQ
ncbi:DinB family protein [Longimicrobium sp.]|uniref:DinB family protein n=1 Tax=Longimicrobium sp. TaxID=2029185 RepID=UPI002F91FD5C